MTKYYSTLRPIGPGTFPDLPDNKVVAIENFDRREYCVEVDKFAWGTITYEKAIPKDTAKDYDLVLEEGQWDREEFGDLVEELRPLVKNIIEIYKAHRPGPAVMAVDVSADGYVSIYQSHSEWYAVKTKASQRLEIKAVREKR